MCMGGGCDQQIHRASAGLAAGFYDRSREAAVTGRDDLVERQGIEPALKNAESSQAFGAHPGGLGNEDPEVQLRQRLC